MKNKILSMLISCSIIVFAGCVKKEKNIDTLSTIKQRGKIIVGVKFDTKPFGYLTKKQELVGFDIDLAKYIAKSILGNENDIEFKKVTPSNRISILSSGKVDMIIATMTITRQRKTVVDFSIPYYVTGQAVLVPKNSSIKSITDLNEKKIIVVFGSTAGESIRAIVPDSKIIGFKAYTDAYKALKQGRADAMSSDEAILMGFALNHNSVRLLPRRYSKELYGVAFRKGVNSLNLKNHVNFIINEMVKSGRLKQLKSKWIKNIS